MTFEKGPYEVRFVNDTVEQIDIDAAIYDVHGHILLLVGAYGHIYNFNTIISLKKMGA
jgi:hypothetical protein